MHEALVALQRKDFRGRVVRLRTLHDNGLDSFEVNYYLGRGLAALSRHREAERHFTTAIERLPAFAAAYRALADSRLALGRPQDALAALRDGQKAVPRDPLMHEHEAAVWRRMGEVRKAIEAYEAVLKLAPDDALTLVRLGELHRSRGDLATAIRLLRDAVARDPAPASYWNSLGQTLGGLEISPAPKTRSQKPPAASHRPRSTNTFVDSRFSDRNGRATRRRSSRAPSSSIRSSPRHGRNSTKRNSSQLSALSRQLLSAES
jgi:tetratricopeptide (TPR) repeat protein